MNFEKIYQTLISIFAKQENLKINVVLERKE